MHFSIPFYQSVERWEQNVKEKLFPFHIIGSHFFLPISISRVFPRLFLWEGISPNGIDHERKAKANNELQIFRRCCCTRASFSVPLAILTEVRSGHLVTT
jgi:hypothetical protein